MKLCSGCKVEKPFLEFSRDKRRKDGLQTRCKACCKDYQAQWYLKNKDKVKAQKLQWVKDNPEKHKAQWKKYEQENRERINELHRKYNKTEAGRAKSRRAQHVRRVRLAETFSERIPTSFYGVLRQKQNNECRYCGISFDEVDWTVEHVTPISRKGPHIRGNIVLLCLPCNSGKQDKTHEEYLEYLEKG